MQIYPRHVKIETGKPCSAIENIQALARNPNGWMIQREIEDCRKFVGTEEEAEILLKSIEKKLHFPTC